MRRLALLAALALLAPGALAGHATYVDENRILGCLLRVQVTTVGAALNCPGIARTVAASEPPGGTYRLTVTWSAADATWAQLEARLVSCDGACAAALGGIGACVNNICAGGGGAGPVIVQEAQAIASSPLVLTIPTAGPETNVSFAFNAAGPVHAGISSQGVHFKLEHV